RRRAIRVMRAGAAPAGAAGMFMVTNSSGDTPMKRQLASSRMTDTLPLKSRDFHQINPYTLPADAFSPSLGCPVPPGQTRETRLAISSPEAGTTAPDAAAHGAHEGMTAWNRN